MAWHCFRVFFPAERPIASTLHPKGGGRASIHPFSQRQDHPSPKGSVPPWVPPLGPRRPHLPGGLGRPPGVPVTPPLPLLSPRPRAAWDPPPRPRPQSTITTPVSNNPVSWLRAKSFLGGGGFSSSSWAPSTPWGYMFQDFLSWLCKWKVRCEFPTPRPGLSRILGTPPTAVHSVSLMGSKIFLWKNW